MAKAERRRPDDELPELGGFGVAKGKEGWLAYRLSTRGRVEMLTPKRHGEYLGEVKWRAVARMMTAIEKEYVLARDGLAETHQRIEHARSQR